MAEEQHDRSPEDLTEEASPYRLEEFRRKGQVAQSREITGLAALLASGVAAYSISPKAGAQIAGFMQEVFRADLSARLDLGSTATGHTFFIKAVLLMASIGLPICLVGFIVGIISSFAQIGSIFSTDPLTPDIEKINPLSGLQRLLSMKNLVEGLRLIFKMSVILFIAYGLVKTEVFSAPSQIAADPLGLFGAFSHAAKVIFLSLIGALAIFAGIDFGLQKREFGKNLRMTKQEAKQEHKEREGDPHIRARIRGIQRDMAKKRMMQAVKKADVIITNPTHLAIALSYDKSNMAAPKVVAKGADFMAQKIKAIAAEAGIPLVENVPLARTLYKSVKVNQYIPRALYQAVAEVLAHVYRLKNKDFV